MTGRARPRALLLGLAGGLGLAVGGLAGQGGAQETPRTGTTPVRTSPGGPQALFERMLLADPRTASRVRTLLRGGGGAVNPNVRFRDLTGDRRVDAVVRVSSGGSAGDVALYVFSADGARNGRLRAVLRRESLYRVTVSLLGRRLVYRVPRYHGGDDLCCPARLAERSVTWSRRSRKFRLGPLRDRPGPGAQSSAAR